MDELFEKKLFQRRCLFQWFLEWIIFHRGSDRSGKSWYSRWIGGPIRIGEPTATFWMPISTLLTQFERFSEGLWALRKFLGETIEPNSAWRLTPGLNHEQWLSFEWFRSHLNWSGGLLRVRDGTWHLMHRTDDFWSDCRPVVELFLDAPLGSCHDFRLGQANSSEMESWNRFKSRPLTSEATAYRLLSCFWMHPSVRATIFLLVRQIRRRWNHGIVSTHDRCCFIGELARFFN
jgi:hypothetical protein